MDLSANSLGTRLYFAMRILCTTIKNWHFAPLVREAILNYGVFLHVTK